MNINTPIENTPLEARNWPEITLESIADAVVVIDRTAAVTCMNAAAQRLTGWTLEDARLENVHKVLVLRRRSGQPFEGPLERVLRGEVSSIEDALPDDAELIRRDRTTISVADSVASIREPSGALSGAVIVFRDVTSKVRELERLSFLSRASVELNASLDYEVTLSAVAKLAVPMIADGCAVVMVKNGEVSSFSVAHVDPEKADLMRARFSMCTRIPQSLLPVLESGEPELIPAVTDTYLDQLEDGCRELKRELGVSSYISVPLKRGTKTIGAIALLCAKSGRAFDASDLNAAVALAERATVAVENARLFEELDAARADTESRRVEAEHANRAKDEFMAMLGHELRNPLAPIATTLDLMKLKAGSSPEHAILERQAKHLTRLVDDLLDVSRITGCKLELTKVALDVAALIANGIDLAAPLLERNHHRLNISVEPGTWVDGDAVRLAQVVSNLLNNAAKYSDRGEPISIRAERDGAQVVLAVRDNGIGIDPAILPRIFEPFVQQPQGRDRAAGGLGLGLAIVRGIVSVHGGTVSAHSDGPGRGAEIVVRLPARERPGTAASREAGPHWRVCDPRVRVLVVDDNSDALTVLVELLRYLGYEAMYADNPLRALELARQATPTIALIDIGLPTMDGYELARQLRKQNGLTDMKVVALTGYGLESDRARSRAAGFNDHLVKPVSMTLLQSMLEKLAGEAH